MAGLHGSVQPGLAIRVVIAQVRHAELATGTVKLALAAFIALRTLEPGQQLAVAPALRTQPGPIVKVLRLAADIEQAVDRAGAAEQAAARPDHLAVTGAGLRLERELP